MAINLNSKLSPKIQEVFALQSLVKGHVSDEYEFTGAKTVRVLTPQTVDLVDYARSGANRYGTPTEMQDTVQEMVLTQDKAFSLTIDKGNYDDGGLLKNASKMLGLEIKERAIPMMDKYIFSVLANKAGKINATSTALTKTTICSSISAGSEYLDDHEVPSDNRTLFITPANYTLLKLSDEFIKVGDLGKVSLAKGQVGEYDGMPVIKVPSSRFPDNVNFLIVYKNSAVAPSKISDTNLHKDPPGISGHLLEGREYFDCFVYGAKCFGIYADVNTASGGGTVLAAPTIAASGGAISGVTGATYYYTTDGTDPRYSSTAKSGAAPDVVTAGTVVKAYATKSGAYASAVATQTLT